MRVNLGLMIDLLRRIDTCDVMVMDEIPLRDCDDAMVIEPVTQTLYGTTIYANNNVEEYGVGYGPDVWYIFQTADAALLTAEAVTPLGSWYPTIWLVDADTLDCEDLVGNEYFGAYVTADGNPFSYTLDPFTTYYLIVDGVDSDDAGSYTLDLEFGEPSVETVL